MLAGQSGVKVLTEDWVDTLPVHIAAPAAVEPSEVLPVPRSSATTARGQFALIAAREAWADAGSPEVDPERLGVVIATGIGGVTTLLAAYDTLKERGARRVLPLTVPMLMPNGPAAAGRPRARRPRRRTHAGQRLRVRRRGDRLRRRHDPQRPRRRRRRRRHRGSDPPAAAGRLRAMQALSTRNDEPERASRPYDKGRDGFVLGEGAGVVVLESARARARPAARRSTPRSPAPASPSDAHHIAQPDPVGAGAARAMKMAVEAAGATPADVVHINAHATSTPVGDVAEAQAIRGRARRRHRRRVRLGDQVDDRAPARRGRRGRDDRDGAGPARPDGPADVQPRGPRRRRHLDVVRGEPRDLPDGERSR